MEDEDKSIHSPFFDREIYKKQIEKIVDVMDRAQKIIDYTSAHDEETLRAIDVVEQFLKRKHRICYGGQAINAHLPKGYKIYDPEYSIPDYDFFTPNQEEDIRTLTKDLRKAGFQEISAREGMHAGTIKIYVNFTPVADISSLDSKLYALLSKRELRYDGISYMDANSLRMLMYLELSRPRGEVKRWDKVYERLMLLNKYVAPDESICKIARMKKGILKENEVAAIMHYVIQENRIFAGGDLLGLYKKSLTGNKKANWLLSTRKPIYIYTPDLDKDTTHFKYELQHISKDSGISVQRVKSLGGDIIPEMSIFLRNKYPVLIIISQNACHSYYSIPLKYNNTLRIATLDTLITLYFGIGLLKYKHMDLASLECIAQQLVEISYRARENPDAFPFPFISLECTGHQKRLASLIREKVQRITTQRRKKALQDALDANARRKTVSRNSKRNSKHTNKIETLTHNH